MQVDGRLVGSLGGMAYFEWDAPQLRRDVALATRVASKRACELMSGNFLGEKNG